MSNNKKVYNKNNFQRKDFVQNKPKKEPKKLDKALFWLLILMFVFWTVGATLAIINTFKGGIKTASAQSYDQFDPYSSDQANLFNNFAYSDTESQIYLNSLTRDLSFETQPYLTTVNTSFSSTSSNITYLRFLYFPLKANTDYTILLNIHSGSPTICQLLRPTTTSESYQSFKSNSGKSFQLIYFATIYDKPFSFNSGAITDYFIFFGIPGNVSSFSFTCYVHLGLDTSYQYQPYLPALIDNSYNQGFEQGALYSTSSIFSGSTLSGTAVLGGGSWLSSGNRQLDFSNIQPDFITEGIQFTTLSNYLISELPEGKTLADLIGLRIDVNFYKPFIYNPVNAFQFNGSYVTYINPSQLSVKDNQGNTSFLTSNNTFVEVSDEVRFWVTNFKDASNVDVLSYSLVYQFSFAFDMLANANNAIISTLSLGLSDSVYYSGYNEGYNDGYHEGIDVGQSEGYQQGKDEFYNSRYELGYKNGLNQGYDNGVSDAGDYTFFSLISSVVDAPLQAVRGMLNFDLLGFNMLNFFYALVTLALIIIFTRIALW